MSKVKNTICNFDVLPITLTVHDVSEIMGISLSKAYELMRRSDFPSIHLNRRIIIAKNSFEKWLETASTNEK